MIERTEEEVMRNWKGDTDTPLVSICTITYNHEAYIEEALDSFLMQETAFPFEMVIDDDCSPDGTANIIQKYIKKYPKIIKANLRKENVGSMQNFIANMKRAQGKYIAICEGDDYWTDPLKLQKQVDFLEGNPEYSLCFHAAKCFDENKQKFLFNIRRHFGNKTFSASRIIVGGGSFIPTASMVFKSEIIKDIPKWIYTAPVGDLFLSLLCATLGKIFYIDEYMSIYRLHDYNWTANNFTSINLDKRLNHHEKMVKALKNINNKVISHKAINQFIHKQIKSIVLKYKNSKKTDVLFAPLSLLSKLDIFFIRHFHLFANFYKRIVIYFRLLF